MGISGGFYGRVLFFCNRRLLGKLGGTLAVFFGLLSTGMIDIILAITDIDGVSMIRTVVSLDKEDKAWLDRKAAQEHVTMTEMVRRAVRRMRKDSAGSPEVFAALLQETSGLWKQGDGLSYQVKLRAQWDRPVDKKEKGGER